MTLIAQDEQAMVAAFLACRRRSPRVFDVPPPLRPARLDEGYGILLAVHRALERAGDRRVGFKVACTTEATRKAMGTDLPAYAGLFESNQYRSLQYAASSQSGLTGYECEMAVRIGKGIDRAVRGWREVLPCIEAVAVACELVVNRYGDPRSVGLPSLIADDWFQSGYVIGSWVDIASAPADLSKLKASVVVNDADPASGLSLEVMGHPLESVAWLANALLDNGDRLRPGDVVLTGSIVAPVWLDAPPSFMRLSIEGLGALQFESPR